MGVMMLENLSIARKIELEDWLTTISIPKAKGEFLSYLNKHFNDYEVSYILRAMTLPLNDIFNNWQEFQKNDAIKEEYKTIKYFINYLNLRYFFAKEEIANRLSEIQELLNEIKKEEISLEEETSYTRKLLKNEINSLCYNEK